MPQCNGTTRAGNRCSRNVPGEFCHQHAAVAAPRVPLVQCQGMVRRTGKRCEREAVAGHFCKTHERIPLLHIDPEIVEEVRNERLIAMEHREFLLARWHETSNTAFYLQYFTVSEQFRELDNEFNELTANPRVAQRRALMHHRAQLAFHDHHQATVGDVPIWRDTQSIHRREVSSQTNALLASLLGDDPESFKEDNWLPVAGWIGAPVGGHLRRDMKIWYDQQFCKQDNDFLYRRILNATVRYASKHVEHEELRKRIFEECTESVGMCCEGHIARLCNALVGFHELASSPVSSKEVLQERMAALAARGGTPEEGEAILVELSIPKEQWDDWLAAL